jgi:hypothetical protein
MTPRVNRSLPVFQEYVPARTGNQILPMVEAASASSSVSRITTRF